MEFNRHSRIEGKHAFLGASRYHWINYDEDKLLESYNKWLAVERGTRLHAFAAEAIRLGIRLPKNGQTLNRYVNDAIGYHMTPEQPLFYSENAFGTADAICFTNGFLRIHDLKSGETRSSEHQLEIYDALFCLEYGYSPFDISGELRIYQSDDVRIYEHQPEAIDDIINKIIIFDQRIAELRGG